MSTVLTPAAAAELGRGLSAVCAQVGVDPASAKLLKFTMNAVFAVDRYVVRMARGDAAVRAAQRLTRVVGALHAAGAPIVELAEELGEQPIVAGEWVATIWHRIGSAGDGMPLDLAAPLRVIHSLDRLSVDVPAWDIVKKCRRRIDQAAALTGTAADQFDGWSHEQLHHSADDLFAVLRERGDRIEERLALVQWALPRGVIHGDAHSGNLILPTAPQRPGPAPDAIICDLDSVSVGPREWDLVATAHGVVRFGRPRPHHDALADAYGFDILTWSGWPVLRDLRELQLVTSVLDNAAGRPDVACQLGHRLRSYLSNNDGIVWTRYH